MEWQKKLHRRLMTAAISICMLLPLAACTKAPAETTVPVEPVTADQAITHLQEQSESLGFDNALDELKEHNTAQVGGDTYIRMQQYYEGIPVYGKTIVYVANEQGELTSVTGNVQDVDTNIDLTPVITAEQAQERIRAYAADELGIANANEITIEEISGNDLCIYTGTTSTALAFVVSVGTDRVILDAHDGSILSWSSAFSFQNVQYTGPDGTRSIMGTAPISGRYILKDQERNIYVYDAQGKAYYYDGETHPDAISLVTSSDTVFGDDDDNTATSELGYIYLDTLGKVHDFFLETVGDSGPELLIAVYNDLYKNPNDSDQSKHEKNGGGGYGDLSTDLPGALPDSKLPLSNLSGGMLIMATGYNEELGTIYDTIGHEYQHIIFAKHIEGGGSALEFCVINEGIADIMGELFQASQEEADWVNDCRDIRDPKSCGYAAAVGDSNDSKEDDVHGYSTIISHSAYLMWNGIDGTESKKLSEQQLAELWYRAVLMMPSDCDFILCRQLVEVAAQSMENLTDEQRSCVREAFDRVGIPTVSEDTEADYHLDVNGTLSVYEENLAYYSGYTLSINGNPMRLPVGDRKPEIGFYYNKTVKVDSAEPYQIDLPAGLYLFKISDAYSPVTYSFSVQVGPGYASNIDLITAYEKPLVAVIPNQTVLGMEVMYLDDQLPNITTYNYSPNGLLQSKTQWDGEYYGTYYYEYIGKTTTYQYNENGFLIRKIQDGSNEIITEYGYQEDGLLSYEHNLYSDIYVRYEYDNNGNCIGSYRYDEDGNLKSSEEYTFDGVGNKLSFTNSWYSDGEVADSGTEYFEYDSDGHLLSSHSDYTKTVYSYDARWNLIRKECTGEEACYTEMCSYDEYDRLIKKTVEEFGYSETTYYTYDEEGNILTISDQYSKTEHHYVTLSGGQEMSDNVWKHAYADFIRSKRGDSPSDTCYYLIDIDGDGFPELFIDYVIHASGKLICTFDGTNVISEYVDHSVFIPGSGLLYSSDSFQGVNQDAVLLIKNGQIERIAEGDWIDEEVAARYGDDPEYTWNGETVSRDAYQEKMSAAFDETQGYPIGSISIQEDGTIRVSPNVLSYEQILSILS